MNKYNLIRSAFEYIPKTNIMYDISLLMKKMLDKVTRKFLFKAVTTKGWLFLSFVILPFYIIRPSYHC